MTPEIRSFEYALGLFAVLVGLAIADIALSVHRLIRHRSSVQWDPLALMATLYAFLIIVGIWFDFWSIRDISETRSYFFYLSIVGELFVVFLLAAASLPDEPHAGADLREYYKSNRRYFWALVLLFQCMYYAHWLYFQFTRTLENPDLARELVLGTTAIAAPIILLCTRSRLVHYIVLAVLIVATLWDRARYSLT